MDVVISSAWRNSTTTMSLDIKDDLPIVVPTKTISDALIRKHGRFEVTLTRDGDSWVVECTSLGRLFGPKQVIYRERHDVPRYAVWDFMARVTRAADNEQDGLQAGREAAAWIRDRDATVC